MIFVAYAWPDDTICSGDENPRICTNDIARHTTKYVNSKSSYN